MFRSVLKVPSLGNVCLFNHAMIHLQSTEIDPRIVFYYPLRQFSWLFAAYASHFMKTKKSSLILYLENGTMVIEN